MQRNNSDCLIIGGGAIGLLSARALAFSGLNICVLERGLSARESSWAGGGILSPLNPWRYPDPVTALAQWGQTNFNSTCKTLAEQTGIDPQWTRSGMLVLDPKDASDALNWAKGHGYRLESHSQAWTEEHHPAVCSPKQSATWLPEIAQLRTPRFGKALRAQIKSSPVHIREGVEVTGIRTQQRRVVGVETNQGPIGADRVVLATGAWSGDVAKMVGLDLDVKPVKGQMLLYKAPPDLLSAIVMSGDRYLIPRRDGRILIGSTLEEKGYDKTPTPEAREDLHQAAIRMVPELANYPIEHHWAGLRPGQSGSIPWIGEHPEIKGLWINTGHYRNGMVLSLASARLLSDLMLQREPILDPTPYAISR